MSLLKKIFDFFLFTSIYISLCSVLMAWQTNHLLHLPYSYDYFWFVFFASMCSYNFHWFLTPVSHESKDRVRWTQEHKNAHLLLYFAGVIGSVVFFVKLHHHWFALLFATFITFLYSAPKIPLPYFRFLKQVAVGKTIFLAAVWTYVTAILPIFVANVGHFDHTMKLFAASRFFLIYAVCILFDYRDKEDDRDEGIRSMITYLDERGIDRLFFFSLIAFTGFTLSLLFAGFRPPVVFILLIPGCVLAALYSYAKTHFSDYLYYFVLDGIMMLSALLLLILSF
ncbi:MAG TPA: UbiA family prenyltransferase [Puia sp.]|nr:UbiA family prenyltransferase [Puia sp.]